MDYLCWPSECRSHVRRPTRKMNANGSVCVCGWEMGKEKRKYNINCHWIEIRHANKRTLAQPTVTNKANDRQFICDLRHALALSSSMPPPCIGSSRPTADDILRMPKTIKTNLCCRFNCELDGSSFGSGFFCFYAFCSFIVCHRHRVYAPIVRYTRLLLLPLLLNSFALVSPLSMFIVRTEYKWFAKQ